MSRRLKGSILVSGRGSNMVALLLAANSPCYPVKFALVASDREDAEGLGKASALGVEARFVCPDDDRTAFEERLDDFLRLAGTEILCLAGFMRILSPGFVARWQGRILNIHPSLLPRHPGLGTHAKAIASGDKESGCSVHVVTETLDGGRVLGQERVPVLPGDTPETLASRVLEAEHRLYPAVLARFAATGIPSG